MDLRFDLAISFSLTLFNSRVGKLTVFAARIARVTGRVELIDYRSLWMNSGFLKPISWYSLPGTISGASQS